MTLKTLDETLKKYEPIRDTALLIVGVICAMIGMATGDENCKFIALFALLLSKGN